MDRGKRASMREGPLSALFRSTAELDEEQQAQPASPAAMKIMSAPFRSDLIWSCCSIAAR